MYLRFGLWTDYLRLEGRTSERCTEDSAVLLLW